MAMSTTLYYGQHKCADTVIILCVHTQAWLLHTELSAQITVLFSDINIQKLPSFLPFFLLIYCVSVSTRVWGEHCVANGKVSIWESVRTCHLTKALGVGYWVPVLMFHRTKALGVGSHIPPFEGRASLISVLHYKLQASHPMSSWMLPLSLPPSHCWCARTVDHSSVTSPFFPFRY